MILEKAKKEDFSKVKSLYFSAFPKEERPPFFFIARKAKNEKSGGEFLVAKEEDEFIGFIYLINFLDMVYVFFFAVEDSKRACGYGSKILKLVKEAKRGKRIFLAREPIVKDAENAKQRLQRREFYIKNGFSDLPFNIVEKGYLFEAMGIGGIVSSSEYDALMTNWCGKFIKKITGMRLIKK